MGKNVGDDLNEGKVTLPLIHTLQAGSVEEQSLVREAITARSSDRIGAITDAVQRCGALDYTRSRAKAYHDLALDSLSRLPESEAREALQRLTDLALHSDH